MENEDFSCVKEVTKIVNLILPSMYNSNEISGICDMLETWKRQYIKQLRGIVVGYKKVSLISKCAYIKVNTPVIYFKVKATFELFYPTIGSIIKGKINRISQDYVGCLVHDTINVAIHQTADLSCDISKVIALDSFILFEITRIIFKSKFIHVKGKITEECVTLMKNIGMFSYNNIIVYDNDQQTTCSSPDFSSNNSMIYNNTNASNNNAVESDDFTTFNGTSNQLSSPNKKKKHKKLSKENSSFSSSISGSLDNDIDNIELIQPYSKKKKHKKSNTTLFSPTNALENDSELMHPNKKIKKEELIAQNVNQFESTQPSDKSRKRKRKKSDQNLVLTSNVLENEIKSVRPLKKMKFEEQIMTDRMEFLENNSSDIFSNISHSENSSISVTTPVVSSPNVGIENSIVKVELLSPAKTKKHKKSRTNLETSSFSKETLVTEINTVESTSHSHLNFNETSGNSGTNFETNRLTSPDLFDEQLSEVKGKTKLIKPKKKKKKNSDKNKTKKDKVKKGSKKDKKKKIKVISTKKKLHGHKIKLKKKKSNDKKSKDSKKSKSKKKRKKSAE